MISGKRAFHGETSADTMSAILERRSARAFRNRAQRTRPAWNESCATAWRKILRSVSIPRATWHSIWKR